MRGSTGVRGGAPAPLPASGCLVWLFSEIANTGGLLLFLLGYAVVPWLSVFAPLYAAFGFTEWLERRGTLMGTVREVEEETVAFPTLGRMPSFKVARYVLVLDRDEDIAVKIKFESWRRREPPVPGSRVRALGRWRQGEFLARQIEPLHARAPTPTQPK